MFLNKYKKQKNNKLYKNGFGLAEIIVAVSIFTIILGSLVTISSTYLSGADDSLKLAKGAYLAEEGIEAIKIIRDTDWSLINELGENTDHYLYFDTSSSTNNIWKATSTPVYVDSIFERTFRIFSTYRDSNGRIVLSDGILDTNTKKATVSISWLSKNGTTTKSLSTYITNII